MQDSMSSWLNRYRDYLYDYFREDMARKARRIVYQVRMDSSKDKMEWTDPQGEVRYMKRLEE